MKTDRLPTRDVRENRAEREEKFGQAMDSLPGKTLRDRDHNGHAPNAPAQRHRAENVPRPAAVQKPEFQNFVPHRAAWFRLIAPQATTVSVAGTFNAWDSLATPLSKTKDGEWRFHTDLAPGEYEYRFIVDGVWQEDPHAKNAVPNPFGGRNSVLRVS